MQISTEIEQRAYIKMHTALNISATVIKEELDLILPKTAYSYRNVANWSNQFKAGRQSVEDEPRSGRPSTATTRPKPCFASSLDQQEQFKSPIVTSE